MSRKYVLATAVGVLAMAVVAWPVYAQNGGGRGEKVKAAAKAMDDAKLTLSKASDAVEAQSKGRAVTARATMDNDVLMINVEVVIGDATKHYQVDKTGKVSEMPDISSLEKRAKTKEEKPPKGGKP